MLFQHAKHRYTLLQTQINRIKAMLNNYPAGKLICVKNGKYTKWFKSIDGKTIYVPKKDKSIAKGLAKRKYYTALLYELSSELELLNNYINGYQKISYKSDNILNNPAYQELIIPQPETECEQIKNWREASYEKNSNYPEQLMYKCMSGEFVRSKSEVIIANALYANNIPYRYEALLDFDELKYYPDFTILHPYTLKEFYWEHFGMMENTTYIDKTFNKLKQFSYNKIYPSINLITTYETKDTPINSQRVNQIILEYFT